MSEVPVVLFNSMRRTFERFGIDTSSCLRGLSLASVPPAAFGGRVSWDELAVFLERCGEGLSPDEQERIGELYPLENYFVHFLLRTALSPALLHRILWTATKPAFPHMFVGIDDWSDARVVVRVELPKRYRGSAVFFRGTKGECATITELFGIGRSIVHADVSPWHGVYDIRFPLVHATHDDLRIASRLLSGDRRWKMPALVGWLFATERGDGAALSEHLVRVHGLDPTEARIVVRLGQGASLGQIASELRWSGAQLDAYVAQHHDRMAEAIRVELAARMLDGT